jgi:hypothetical protein
MCQLGCHGVWDMAAAVYVSSRVEPTFLLRYQWKFCVFMKFDLFNKFCLTNQMSLHYVSEIRH